MTRKASLSQGKATYVATKLEKAWLLGKQRILYARSKEYPDYVFRKLWGFVTDLHNLRAAFQRVARNHGSRTAGVDRVTVRMLTAKGTAGVDAFLAHIQEDLRTGAYLPSPVRRVLIPKASKPREFRPLGIPIPCAYCFSSSQHWECLRPPGP